MSVTTELTLTGPVHKLCDETRGFALQHMIVSKGNSCVYVAATNGAAAVVRQEMGETDRTCYMPAELAKNWHKRPKCQLNGQWEARIPKTNVVQVSPAVGKENQRYPRLDQVLPTVNDSDRIAIKLNVQLLYDLAAALASAGGKEKHLTLFINKDEPTNFIMIKGPAGIGAIGTLRFNKKNDAEAEFDEYNSTLDEWASRVRISELNEMMQKPEEPKK